VTFTIESKVYRVFDYLENLNCPVPIIAQVTSCAPKNQFWNWDRAYIFQNADAVQEGLNNLVSGGADDNEVTQTFDMEADEMIRVIPLAVSRDMSIAETVALNHIFACDQDICAGPCGAANERCDTLYAVSDPVAGSAAGTADVWIMSNGVWNVTAADPFEEDEVIIGGACFAVDRNTTRLLVFRGSTDAGAPAESSYTDDGGVTWNNVNIGSTNGEFIINSGAIASLSQNNIWVGTNMGRIYYSSDGGASWSVQEDQGMHTAAFNWIHMMDDRTGMAGGAADVIAVTVDGGQVWSQVNSTDTGGDITTGGVVDLYNFWVGTDDGRIFFTSDGGVTWNERNVTGSGEGRVDAMQFVNNMIGYIAMRDDANKTTFLSTRNGGFSWEVIVTPTNSGINSMVACGINLLWAVGEAANGRPVVYKLQPAA
jgi:photosystem II stability/assembly factor-like uncharacterized protein